jgi:hypothetical protein
MIRRWLLVGGLTILSACGSAPPPPRPVDVAPSPAAGLDGHYHGIARLIRAAIRGCPRSGSRVVTVEGNALSLNYRGATVSYALTAIVGPDGTIHGSDGRGTIEGRITASGHMDLTVSSEYCEVRYALERS